MPESKDSRKKNISGWRNTVGDIIRFLKSDGSYRKSVFHHEYIPAVKSSYSELSPELPQPLLRALRRNGIKKLYSHQVDAVQAVRAGSNVLVSTPTASGKTLVYNLPVLESCLEKPETKALYLFPLKALEQDQKRKLLDLAALLGTGERITGEIYDGDTSAYRRRKILAELPNIILTNPDMLHMSLLAYHEKWEDFFKSLRYVVVDELHAYKGIFGAHFAGVMRRLRRTAGRYGSQPVFIASSATVGNPKEFAGWLFGLPFTVVDHSGAPSAARHFVFINPQDLKPATVAARLLREFVASGLKTIAFTKSRKNTELIHSWVLRSEPKLARRISSYRSGYLPSERRAIERSLADDTLDAVISTSALEMGIDIGGLDACLLVGYPGTVTQTWQRGGRVGRSGRESVIVLIAQQDALDQYFMRHPEDFFRRGCEHALVDPENPFILRDHIECAAAEFPLEPDEFLNEGENYAKAVEELKQKGRLLESMSNNKLYSARKYPQRDISLRQAGESFSILDTSKDPTGRVGSIGGTRALAECHEGAIYLHRARQYVVTRLDLEKCNIYVCPSRDPYYTQVISEKDTEILEVLKSKPEGNYLIKYGRLKVTERIVGFQKRSIATQGLLSTHQLNLPPQVFETTGFWIEIPEGINLAVEQADGHFMGGLHAVEHAIISIFPLYVLCDRNDIGGICFTSHPKVGGPAIFIYDSYPGGVGIAYGGYGNIGKLLKSTQSLIAECDCDTGCPSCIHSPKCGSGNKPLDKQSAVLVLEILQGLKELPEVPGHDESEGSAEIAAPIPGSTGGLFPADKKIYVFDLETQRSAKEVGGWGNKHLMKVSVAVLLDVAAGEILTYTEADVEAMIEQLSGADLVVGFNILDFDYQVLRAYSPVDFSSWNTFDILKDIRDRLGHRLSLDSLATATLETPKSADGLDAIRWYREGKIEKIIDYCTSDVNITFRLFEHGLKKNYFLFDHKSAGRVKLNLDWDLCAMLGR